MAKFSTPGQRRKRFIKVALVFAVVTITGIAWFVEGPDQRIAKAAIADPQKVEIQATISDLREEEETYRNLKGKRRTRTNHYADFSYELNGSPVTENREISSSQFEQWVDGDQVELWAIGPKHDVIKLKSDIQSDANTSPLARCIQAAMFSGIGAVVLGFILVPLLGREPDGYMPVGFYTDNSWLDIDDNQLIAIIDSELVRYKFDSSLASKIQNAYQENTPLEQIVAIQGKGVKLDTIPLAKIQSIASSHYEDTYDVEFGTGEMGADGEKTKSMSLEFLNPTVKTHAMTALATRVQASAQLDKTVSKYSRIKSCLPGLIGIVVGAAGFWYFEHWILLALFGLLILGAGKSAIARLWSPTVRTEYKVQTAGEPTAGLAST